MTDDLEGRLADTLRSRAATVSARPDAWERLEAATRDESTGARVTSLTAARDRRLMVGAPAALIGLAAALALVFGVGHRPPRPREMAASAPPVRGRADAGAAAGGPPPGLSPARPPGPDGAAGGGVSGPTLAVPGAGGGGPAVASRPLGSAATAGFRPLSVTFVSASEGWVLGRGPCAVPTCPVTLVHTRDGGRTWAPVSPPGDDVSAVRFADAANGWAFGPGLRATHDGGTTWRPVTLPGLADGAQVSSVEAAAGSVQAAVVNVAGSGPEVRMETSPVAIDAWRLAGLQVPAGAGPVPHAQVVLHGDRGWLMVVNRQVVGGARLAGGTWQTWTPPCRAAFGPGVLAASSDADLVAGCDAGVWGGTRRAEDALVSHDDGDTFAAWPAAIPVSAVNAIATLGGGTAFAGGPAGEQGGVLVATQDGGATWTTVFRQAGGGSWVDLGFTTATQGAAVVSGANGSSILLMTRDGGRSWQPVTFTAASG
ncbi:MAG: hypothetical protein NVSMB16_09330 [Acidimicrobiales bacterium]